MADFRRVFEEKVVTQEMPDGNVLCTYTTVQGEISQFFITGKDHELLQVSHQPIKDLLSEDVQKAELMTDEGMRLLTDLPFEFAPYEGLAYEDAAQAVADGLYDPQRLLCLNYHDHTISRLGDPKLLSRPHIVEIPSAEYDIDALVEAFAEHSWVVNTEIENVFWMNQVTTGRRELKATVLIPQEDYDVLVEGCRRGQSLTELLVWPQTYDPQTRSEVLKKRPDHLQDPLGLTAHMYEHKHESPDHVSADLYDNDHGW